MKMLTNVWRVPLCLCVLAAGSHLAAQEDSLSLITVPAGAKVELVADSPLVQHPLMADFDEQGRLYIAATAGANLSRPDLEKQLPNFVQRLEDSDGDGRFDKATVFADKLTFPQGCLWWRGSLYVASSGAIWKFTDTNDDGVADKRVKLVGDFGYTGNAADVHGPFAGPDNRIYWCDGRHGHEIKDEAGQLVSRGKAARIFSCREDGSDVQSWCTGGMDNPVEVVFLPRGEMLGTVNLLYSTPRGDCLVNWQYGGVYPRYDFVESNHQEFVRTGPVLKEVYKFGHVAVSGLCRLEGEAENSESILVTEFNTNRVKRVTLNTTDNPFQVVRVEDEFVSADRDFHPTDVLQDADGSVLVINTGGWFRIGCPQSQVEKSHIHGAIYRVKGAGLKPVADPRGLKMNWASPSLNDLVQRLGDSRSAVQNRAVEALALLLKASADGKAVNEARGLVSQQSPQTKLNWIRVLARVESPASTALLIDAVSDQDTGVRQLATRCLLYAKRPEGELGEKLYRSLLQEVQSGSPSAGINALATLTRLYSSHPGFAEDLLRIRNPHLANSDWRHAFVYALIASNARDVLGRGLFGENEELRLAVSDALTEIRRPKIDAANQVWLDIPAAGTGKPLTKEETEKLHSLVANLAPGDVARGKHLFAMEKTGCVKCHRVQGEGGQIGPDLSTIGRSRGKIDLLEALLYPSASFARGFAPYVIATESGHVYSGIVLSESSSHVRLGLNKDQSVSVPIAEVEEIKAADVSIMPNDVVSQLTSDELADLISYLQSLQ